MERTIVALEAGGERAKQAKRTSEEQRVVTSVDGILVTTLGVVISDGKDFEDTVKYGVLGIDAPGSPASIPYVA